MSLLCCWINTAMVCFVRLGTSVEEVIMGVRGHCLGRGDDFPGRMLTDLLARSRATLGMAAS